jgi:hypothetical protein
MSGEVKYLSFSTDTKPLARTITEIRLRDDAQPSDFRVPLPSTKEAIARGCTCPPQPQWPRLPLRPTARCTLPACATAFDLPIMMMGLASRTFELLGPITPPEGSAAGLGGMRRGHEGDQDKARRPWKTHGSLAQSNT